MGKFSLAGIHESIQEYSPKYFTCTTVWPISVTLDLEMIKLCAWEIGRDANIELEKRRKFFFYHLPIDD